MDTERSTGHYQGIGDGRVLDRRGRGGEERGREEEHEKEREKGEGRVQERGGRRGEGGEHRRGLGVKGGEGQRVQERGGSSIITTLRPETDGQEIE